jgi:hypothetical protein
MLFPLIFVLAFLPFLFGFSGDPLVDLMTSIIEGDGRVIAAMAISLVMLLFASVRERVSWLRSDRGGTLSVLVLAYGGALVVALRDDVDVTAHLFLHALEVALIAIGGYTGVRRLIWPKDKEALAEPQAPAAPIPSASEPPADLG